MIQSHSYILVEGQHDVLFLGKLLRELGLSDVQDVNAISAVWEPFINTAQLTEHRGRIAANQQGLQIHQLFEGVCFQNDSHSVVLRKVGGSGAKFRRDLRSLKELIDGGFHSLSAIGLVPDADNDANAVFGSTKDALESVGLAGPAEAEQIVDSDTRTGIFLLPGDGASGALEDLLIDCANAVYPSLLTGATRYIDEVDREGQDFLPVDLNEIKTPQGRSKAIVGCVSSFLKPGSTIQVSVYRDRWVSENSLKLPRVTRLCQFLTNLCGLT